MERVYFDHNATTPLDDAVQSQVGALLANWGNPSSIHFDGRGPKALLRESRKNIARWLNCKPLEVVFTSGGTESDNAAIFGVFFREWRKKQRGEEARLRFITSRVEHPAVLKAFEEIARLGAEVCFLEVDINKGVQKEHLQRALDERPTALVSIMTANNETGLILQIPELAAIAHAAGALFHTDAVQALGKIPVDLKAWDVDLASFSAHKVNALKGAGVLYQKTGVEIDPLLWGGSQERKRRGGTENLLSIASLNIRALDFFKPGFFEQHSDHLLKLRDRFEHLLHENLQGIFIHSIEGQRLPNTSSLHIDGVDGETLLMNLDVEGFSVSTGAACSSGSPEPSPALLAFGLSREQAQASLRVSFGMKNTLAEVEAFVQTLVSVVQRLRSLKTDFE